MPNKDNTDNFNICQMSNPANATTTVTSSPVNLTPYNSATILFSFGAASADTLSANILWTCKITECDTYNGSFTDVAAGEITNLAANSVVVDANGELALTYKIGYKGNAKYLKGVVTATGTHTYGNVIGVYAVLGDIKMGPGSDSSVAVATA